jgi:hypothetical protein
MNSMIKAIIKNKLTCGSCAGFKRENLFPDTRQGSKGCIAEGKTEESSRCPKFRTDVLSLSEKARKSGTLNAILDTNLNLELHDLKLLGAAMLQEHATREAGFMGGQRVYVRVLNASNRNYLSNFVAARVLAADAKTVKLVSDDGLIVLQYENDGLAGPSIYSEENFAPLQAMMIEAGNYVDKSHIQAKAKPLNGTTFDKPPRDLKEVRELGDSVRGRGKKVRREYNLTDIVASINAGYDLGSNVDDDTGEAKAGVAELSTNKFAAVVTEQRKRTFRKKPQQTKVAGKGPRVIEMGDILN